jgi:hypothetical protein
MASADSQAGGPSEQGSADIDFIGLAFEQDALDLSMFGDFGTYSVPTVR